MGLVPAEGPVLWYGALNLCLLQLTPAVSIRRYHRELENYLVWKTHLFDVRNVVSTKKRFALYHPSWAAWPCKSLVLCPLPPCRTQVYLRCPRGWPASTPLACSDSPPHQCRMRVRCRQSQLWALWTFMVIVILGLGGRHLFFKGNL